MLLNKSGKVFAGTRRNGKDDHWQMPQGGIDVGEEPWQAAQRELYEETGVSDVAYFAEMTGWISYDFPPETRRKLYGSWKKYKGQAQKW
eukprot:CAMPEP_0177587718 /NCGR_PEP_ID=MMETSP0419_2-20121207/5811_1 /TAXON_ID=582737 /ORGANISM="Tetraselmis sp., Strain GSL018" /LENGTH=88 /DNA_ID=CAMNT_0019077807 /DNA_START=165 /DNA_END=227 /DNA_ORIENTATION=+